MKAPKRTRSRMLQCEIFIWELLPINWLRCCVLFAVRVVLSWSHKTEHRKPRRGSNAAFLRTSPPLPLPLVKSPPLVMRWKWPRKVSKTDKIMLSHCTLIQLNLLAHEFRYHPVERASLEVQYLPRPTDPFLPGAEATEILGGEGHDVGSEFNLNPSLGLSSDGHVKEDDGVSSGHGLRACRVTTYFFQWKRGGGKKGGKKEKKRREENSLSKECFVQILYGENSVLWSDSYFYWGIPIILICVCV